MLLEKVYNMVVDAVLANHRRLLVISGSKNYELCSELVSGLLKKVHYNFLFLTHKAAHKDKFSFKCAVMEFKDIKKLIGTTQDSIIIDLNVNICLNDIGRSVETVRGGGLVIFLTPSFVSWESQVTNTHKQLVSPPFTDADVLHNFVPWFIRKLEESGATCIIDSDKRKFVKLPKILAKKAKKQRIIPPLRKRFDMRFYTACATQDQVEVLKAMERMRDILVLTADRGRGKSAVLGIGVSAFLKIFGSGFRVVVTAPAVENVQTFFQFAKKMYPSFKSKKCKGLIIKLFSPDMKIEYERPCSARKKACDLLVVDEAAALQIPTLLGFVEKTCAKKIIFSSTIHGYEGAGRGFSILFLGKLKERDPNYLGVSMQTPIRYFLGCGVEKWLNDTLLLDAEPLDVKEADLDELSFVELDRSKLFSEQEDVLRQFVGIYVLAHYRNRPDDIFFLASAPHARAFALLASGKLVASLVLVKEGGISEETEFGNLIPDRVMKHYQLKDFGKMIGYRVQRVAVHPCFQGRGLGSRLLKEFPSLLVDADWVGTTYGANKRLVNFWNNNGFFSVHISPILNPVSGEYSVIQLKPQKENPVFKELNFAFRKKLSFALSDPYSGLDAGVARALFFSPFKFSCPTGLSEIDVMRLSKYLEGSLTYESVVDVLKQITNFYFVSNLSFLSPQEELVLIMKCLQNSDWLVMEKRMGIKYSKIFEVIREAIRKIWDARHDFSSDNKIAGASFSLG